MNLLRRTLYWQAAVWALVGAALAAAPHLVLVDLLSQRFLADYAWVRLVGAQAVGLALLMVLVGQRIEELWWWSWAFVITTAAVTTIALMNALFSVPSHSAAWPWWLFTGIGLAFAVALLWGMARAGNERPPA